MNMMTCHGHAVLYAGMADWAELSEKEDGYDFYYRWLLRIGSRNQYQLGSWMYHADFIAVAQVYLDLYNKYGQERMIWHTLARTDWVIGHPAKGNLELDYSRIESLDRWSWCDALFMAPPVYAKLYAMTGDKKYVDFLNREYRATYDSCSIRKSISSTAIPAILIKKKPTARKCFGAVAMAGYWAD